MVTLASVLLGALVGLIQALTGAGGGILAVPLLVFGLSLSVATAVNRTSSSAPTHFSLRTRRRSG